jgi:hypothetical protein
MGTHEFGGGGARLGVAAEGSEGQRTLGRTLIRQDAAGITERMGVEEHEGARRLAGLQRGHAVTDEARLCVEGWRKTVHGGGRQPAVGVRETGVATADAAAGISRAPGACAASDAGASRGAASATNPRVATRARLGAGTSGLRVTRAGRANGGASSGSSRRLSGARACWEVTVGGACLTALVSAAAATWTAGGRRAW